MKRYLPLLISLSISLSSLILVGCSKGTQPAGSERPSPAQAQISSSADVVKVSAADVSVNAGQSVDAGVKLSIRSGFHVNANPPTFSYLIATEVTPGKVDGITTGKPVYPDAVKRKFQFADQPLAVYEGDALVKVPISAAGNAAKGARSLPINLRVQACDEEQCFPPATLNATIQIEVK